MTRGYLLRLLVWALLLLIFLALTLEWSVRTMPANPELAPSNPGAKAPTMFPILHQYVMMPLAWLRDCFLFVVELIVMILLARGLFGQALGVPDLFLADHRWVRWANGFLFGLTSGNALFVAYVINSDTVPWPLASSPTLFPVPGTGHNAADAAAIRISGQFLLWTWIPVQLLMVIGRPRGTPWIALGLLSSLLCSIGLVMLGWFVFTHPEFAHWREWYALTPGAADGRIPSEHYVMHAIATGFTVLPLLLIIALSISSLMGRPGSPVWVCALSLWLFNATYGFISFHFQGLQFVILGAISSLIVVANAWHPYKLKLPGLEPEYALARAGRPRPLGVTQSPVGKPVALLSGEEVLAGLAQRWADQHRDGSKPKLLVMCTSGGGIRAGLWTAHILHELESRLGTAFQQHLRLITGASGGMVAAALYAGRQIQPLADGRTDAEVLAMDSLWPTWQGLFFRDAPGVVLPFYRNWDRAHSLEASWLRNARAADLTQSSPLSLSFAQLLEAERQGRAPSLIFSPLLVEDGRRLLISNLALCSLASESAMTLGLDAEGQLVVNRQRISQPAVEFFRLFPNSHNRFSLATAARLSATFPYVSPAVSLPTTPARRVVDAGFFDNYGVGLAASWLLRNRDLILNYCSGLAVLEVRAFPLEEEKTGLPETSQAQPGDLLSTVIGGLSVPAEAMGVVRAAGAYYRNDHLLGLLDAEFNKAGETPFFVRVPLECPGDGSLSWAVNQSDQIAIRDQLIHCEPAIKALARWFGNGGGH